LIRFLVWFCQLFLQLILSKISTIFEDMQLVLCLLLTAAFAAAEWKRDAPPVSVQFFEMSL
jgi:hypothetical protein